MKSNQVKFALLAAFLVISFLPLGYSAEKIEVPLSAVKDDKYSELTVSQLTKEKVSVEKTWVKQEWIDQNEGSNQQASKEEEKIMSRGLNTDWDWNWDRGPDPELTKKRVENPEDYNVQGLRVNADFKVDLQGRRVSSKPNLKEGTYWVPAARAGKPNLTREDIRKLAGKPEKAREKIDVLFEALAFMNLAIRPGHGNVKKKGQEGIRWQYPKPAKLAIKEMEANCAASANVINYLLKDDYEEVGFFWWHTDYDIDQPGGHVVSYIKHETNYYFFDPVSLTGKKSKFPVEDGDRSSYNGDVSAHVIQSKPVNYAIYWSQRHRSDQALFAMFSSPDHRHFAIGTEGKNSYYPASFDGANLTIWEDPNDDEKLLQASYTPEPPHQYSDYPPYDEYSEGFGDGGHGEPTFHSLLSDDKDAIENPHNTKDWPSLEGGSTIKVTSNKEIVYPNENKKWKYHLYFKSDSRVDLKKIVIKEYTKKGSYRTFRVLNEDWLRNQTNHDHSTLEPNQTHGTGFGLGSKSDIYFRDHIFIGVTKNGEEAKGAIRVIFSQEEKEN